MIVVNKTKDNERVERTISNHKDTVWGHAQLCVYQNTVELLQRPSLGQKAWGRIKGRCREVAV